MAIAVMRNQIDPQSVTDLTTPSAAEAALRTFFQIARAWSLTEGEQMELLGCSRSEYFTWKASEIRAGLDRALIERLSHIFGIYSALQQLLPIPERANAWIKRANTAPLFNGRSALELMLAGQTSDLFAVRQYLEAQLGGSAD